MFTCFSLFSKRPRTSLFTLAGAIAVGILILTSNSIAIGQTTATLTDPTQISSYRTTSNRSVPFNFGNPRFKNAKTYLTQVPKFQDHKKYLVKPKPQPRIVKRISRRQSTSLTFSDMNNSAFTQDRDGFALDEFDVSDVHAPISAVPFKNIYQVDGNLGLLKSEKTVQSLQSGEQLNYSLLTGSEFVPSSKSWLAPNFAHRPLYFEETQLERYGNELPFQNLVSGVHFFSTLPLLPYKMGRDLPWECQYTYGYHRPGDCVPYVVVQRPVSIRGLLSQALWTSAIALP